MGERNRRDFLAASVLAVPAVLAAWIDLASGRPVASWPDAPLASALLQRLTGRPAECIDESPRRH